ncbi:SMC-Scp complex subunit ScpB [Rhodothermus marinus]|uniref:SMC-Scp complex subunit ScpB n=1 Tax=Rhodothermus marinus TaxID=29549 RepID=UPI0037C67704
MSQPERNGTAATPLMQGIEALLFVADAPLSAEALAVLWERAYGTRPEVGEIEQAIAALNDVYEQTGRVFRIYRWGGGFRLATVAFVSPLLQCYKQQETKLSQTLLETLAIIAYRQPITKPEIDHIRGVNSDYAIRRLQELELIEVKGRSDTIGRPLLYGTTQRFLEHFGLNSLDDLPELPELQQLLENPEVQREHLRLLYPLDPEQNEASE